MTATAGVILLNELMPSDLKFNPNEHITKKVYSKKLSLFAEKYPEQYKEKIHEITALAEKMAYYLGANVGSKDLKLPEKVVESHIKKVEKEFKSAKTEAEKKRILVKSFNEAQEHLQKMDLKDNEIMGQVKSSARGKPAQMTRMSWAPYYSVGMDQTPNPVLIKNNFVKGLNAQEYFGVSAQGRYSAVQTANATSEPGEFAKVLVANADNQTITMKDCGTRNGICMSKDDHHIVSRYEAGTNKLIDDVYWKQLKNNKSLKCVRVRSPITCQAGKGICAMCYGLMVNGRLPTIGTEVGITAAQNIGEPTTQMVLSTKHSVGAKDEDDSKLFGMEGFKTVVNSPDLYKQKATLATQSGKITKITPSPQGGYLVYVNDKPIHIIAGRKPIVKVGDKVFKGDALSDGIASVKDVMDNIGIGAARQHEAFLMHQTFENTTGKDLNKKHFEVIAKSHLALAKDDLGQIKDYNAALKNYPNIKIKKFVSNDLANGKYYLAEDADIFLKGTLIDEFIVNKLKMHGISQIEVTEQKPPVKPIYKTMVMRPNFGRDVFAKLNYRYLQKAITDEVKRGEGFKTKDLTSAREKHTAHKKVNNIV